MKPIEFKEQNTIFAENQKEYFSLPVYKALNNSESVTSCWVMTDEEKKEFAKTGKIWLTLLTYGKPLQPVTMEIKKPI